MTRETMQLNYLNNNLQKKIHSLEKSKINLYTLQRKHGSKALQIMKGGSSMQLCCTKSEN